MCHVFLTISIVNPYTHIHTRTHTCRYKSYLAANNVTLMDLAPSGGSWEDALPLSRLNLTEGTSADAQARRLRFYWGVRFTAWCATTFYAAATAALVREHGHSQSGGPPLTVYSNYNNFKGR